MLWKRLARPRALLADAEDLAFGVVEDLRDRPALRVERAGRDLVAGGDELAKHRALANDLGVAADVGRARHALRERVEVDQAAAVVGLAEPLQLLEDGDDVGRLGRVDERGDRAVDQAVLVAIEVVVAEQVADPVPRAVVEQQPAEDALLGLGRVRRNAQASDVVVGADVGRRSR